MKKFLAAVLVMCMVFSVCAYADTKTELVFDEDLYDGMYLTVCEVMDMYLPTDWYDYTEAYSEALTDDDMPVGAVVGNEDQTQLLVVSYITAENVTEQLGVSSLEELKEAFEADDYTDVELIVVNEIDMLTCVIAEKYGDARSVFIPDSNGGVYVLSFYPASDEDFAAIADNIVASIKPAE